MSIVIIGGGMIGLVLALMLSKVAQGNFKISLIAQNSLFSYDISLFLKSPRVIALSRGAYLELMKLIDIQSILSVCSTSIKKIEISEHGSFNKVFIRSEDYQLSELGYVIEVYPIIKQLFDILNKQSDVIMYDLVTIKYIQYQPLNNIIFLNNGMNIVAKLIIVSDGSCSQCTINYGIQWVKYNYYQTAVVSEITMEVPHYGQAFERFTPSGSLAFLPMSNNLNFLIWCIPNEKRKTVSTWSNNKFACELQSLFGWKLGKVLSIGTRYFYNLDLVYAKNHVAHRVVLVGSAAQRIHPIAGQGFNLGMRDIIVLFNIICQALCNNSDIGDYSMLNIYQKSRRIDQYKTIIITDSLIRLFGNDYFFSIMTRKLGLFCLENIIFLKRFFINHFLSWKID